MEVHLIMSNYSVYMHKSPKGKVYIGITSKKPEYRWANGEGYRYNSHFYRAIQKYGWDNFEHIILSTGLSKEQACKEEIRLISEYNSTCPAFGYNRSIGGNVPIMSPETRLKISIASKQRKRSPLTAEQRANISKGRAGISTGPMAELTKAKISRANTGKTISEFHKLAISQANRGKIRGPLGEETRRKISCANKAVYSDKHRRAGISARMKNKTISEHTKAKLRAACTHFRILQIDNISREVIRQFDTAYDAARWCIDAGLSTSSIENTRNAIYDVCNDKKKSAYKHSWQKIELDLTLV